MLRGIIVFAVVLFSTAAFAAGGYLATGDVGNYPDGFPAFCDNNPSQCKPAKPTQISVAKWKQTLIRINNRVNQTIKFKDDAGGIDVWSIVTKEGDCEDYALTKRAALIKAGIPAGALRIAFVKSRKTGLHAILVVSTDEGDFFLDNFYTNIQPVNSWHYTWITVQDVTRPRIWLTVH